MWSPSFSGISFLYTLTVCLCVVSLLLRDFFFHNTDVSDQFCPLRLGRSSSEKKHAAVVLCFTESSYLKRRLILILTIAFNPVFVVWHITSCTYHVFNPVLIVEDITFLYIGLPGLTQRGGGSFS